MVKKNKAIEKFIKPGMHVHLVGIGGVSMRPLGLVLKGMGLMVTGSDMSASVSTDELINQGIPVFIGHRAENIKGADCIIRTAAAHNDNPEIAAARAGATGKEVDGAARAVITEAGYGKYFGHSFGHGVGVEIHEAPNASPMNEKPLPEGAVISAEPGIYLPGKLGVRIEDVIVLTEDGCRNITNAPKELIVL